MRNRILPQDFYLSDNVVAISQALLGKILVTTINNQHTAGMIVETEAYCGPEDKASHAYNQRRTNRTKTMYLKGGVAYIYLCYGIHDLFNIVTAEEDIPHAVLIRAIEPLEGIDVMLKRRKMLKSLPQLTAGPGVLTQALGISRALDAYPVTEAPLFIEDRKIKVGKRDIIASPRVGIDYAEEYKEIPWRFRLRHNP